MRKKTLREQDIISAFAVARTKVATFIHDYNVDCSTNIIFAGFNEEQEVPIKVWYNCVDKLFCMTFSCHYMKNAEKKVIKLFVRYLVCTNNNGTFKTIEKTMQELRKIKGEFFEDTFSNDFLTCDVEVQYNVMCKKCHKKFMATDEIVNNIENYGCACGGELVTISSSVSAQKQSFYLNSIFNNNTIDTTIFTEEYFEGIACTAQDVKEFKAFLNGKKKVNRHNMKEELERVVETQNVTLLKMYDFVFPKQYCSAVKYMKKKPTAFIMENHSPSYKKPAKKTESKPELNREDFPCNDDNYAVILNYASHRKSSRAIKPLLKEAIESQNNDMITSLLKVDENSFKGAVRYLKKSERKYLEGMAVL